MIDSLSSEEKQLVVAHITGESKVDTSTSPDDLVLNQEELAELLTPKEPLSGRQIVEAGLLGGWKDLGIEDSVAWVEQQRARRREKHRW